MYINKNIPSNTKPGFTLIEVIVTIAILSIVLMLAFSMNMFGNITFNRGSRQSDIQSTLRLAANYVTKELRYSSNVEILTAMTAVPDSSKEYIYVDASGSIKHYDGGNIKTIIDSSSGNTADLDFKQQDYQTVYFKLTSSLRGQNYSIDSSTLLLNIGSKIINGPESGKAISFTPGEPMVLNVNTKPVASINIAAPSNTILVSGGTLQLSADVLPDTASVQTVTWSVNNTVVATIDPNSGLLKTITSTANVDIVVKAIANDGSGAFATYTVRTTASSVQLTAFSISSASNYVSGDGGTLQMRITGITPSNATNQAVEWSISGSTAAVINADTGLITVNTNPTNIIDITVTAKSKSNAAVLNSKVVRIIPKISLITITSVKSTINETNDSLQLTATVTPPSANSAAAGAVTVWSVSGDPDASITQAGVLRTGSKKVKKTLAVTFTLTSGSGKSYSATKSITITK